MIGPRIGPKIGPRVGAAIGAGEDELGGGFSLENVAFDPQSLIYCPENAEQWRNVLGVAGISTGGPLSTWLCQEPSGDLVDQIGGVHLTATDLSYATAITGWERLAVAATEASATSRAASTNAALPNILTTSALILAYVSWASTPGDDYGVCALGTTTLASLRVDAANRLKSMSGANIAFGTANPFTGAAVRPIVHQISRGLSRVRTFSNQERLAPTFSALETGKQIQIGATNVAASDARYLYVALFAGNAANMTEAKVKKLLQTLGWTIPWSPV